jgi:Lon protease-like protein
LLRGLSRARILTELSPDKPYRRARVELVSDKALPVPEPSLRARLIKCVKSWFSGLGLDAKQLQQLCEADQLVGGLCDILGFSLPLTVEFKQQLLEELDVNARVRQLLHYLETNEPPKSASAGADKFPPDFSSN